MLGSMPLLSQALEDPHAPETSATGNIPDMTVLLKCFGLDIITGSEAAT